jgi:hypothetical protein
MIGLYDDHPPTPDPIAWNTMNARFNSGGFAGAVPRLAPGTTLETLSRFGG